MRLALPAVVTLAVAAGPAIANPDILRAGANHHLGDDSFVALYGHVPTAADSEATRMHAHLQYVRDWLASRPATSPERASRRTELLGYLDDYIAAGITPKNTYVPYRNPVFIDADGRICAVGYLIERSVGRKIAEDIAAAHRLDYLEDIAAAMPQVQAWIESSGFTLDELSSIQPGYEGPDVMHEAGFVASKDQPDWQGPMGAPIPATDGDYALRVGDMQTVGAFKSRKMKGTWTVLAGDKVRGRGTFKGGAGAWTSYRANGTKLAEGTFANNRASGTWTFYHPSGRVAAKGPMHAGKRDGLWTFFYDTEKHNVLSKGRFKRGDVLEGWKHYNAAGKLVATTRGRAWSTLTLDAAPLETGVRHVVHQGYPAESYRLDGFSKNGVYLYVDRSGSMFDSDGNQLSRTNAGWIGHSCDWSKKAKASARNGSIEALHEYLIHNTPEANCVGKLATIPIARGKLYEELLASRAKLQTPMPVFDINPTPDAAPASSDEPMASDDTAVTDPTLIDNPADFATYLADHMTWYVEWPHVDDSFRSVFATLPGYTAPSDEAQ